MLEKNDSAVAGGEKTARDTSEPADARQNIDTAKQTLPASAIPETIMPGQQGATWWPMLRFTGKGGAYFWILFKTFVLSLLTLGVYSFWGKTRQRQYIWSNTYLFNEPLEYTGTGKELFISFIIVMPVFLLLVFGVSFLMQILGPAVLVIFYIGFIFAWQFATYKAVRYRLTRTRWRGIRGNLSGSALGYAAKSMGYILAICLSLGLLLPWASGRMTSMVMNNIWLGNRKVEFTGSIKTLYLGLLASVLCSIVILGISTAITSMTGVFTALTVHTNYQDPMYQGLLTITSLVIALALSVSFAFYQAAFFRFMCNGICFGQLRVHSTLSGMRYFGIMLSNILLILVTLGIGTAWVLIRDFRVKVHSVNGEGDPQISTLLQDTQSAPSRGEGLLEALDVNIGI